MDLLEPAMRESREPLERSVPVVPRPSALEADFPGVELSLIAERESWRKEVHRPATSTHKWWAKRLGSVFRGIIASSFSQSKRTALDAYSNGMDLQGLTIFDPFAGSGTTAVEATKLGAQAVAFDINPVATLVQRQAIQAWDETELIRAFGTLETACRPEIDRVHRTETGEQVLYYFWVAEVDCPECSHRTRLFSSQVFSQHAYPRREPAARAVCPECLDIVETSYDFDSTRCSNGHEFSRRGAVTRGSMTCGNGHISSIVDALRGKPPRYKMYAKLVLGEDGSKRYERISPFDHRLYEECTRLLAEREDALVLPDGTLEDGENTRQAIRWGFSRWRQFFNARQLYSLGLIASAIRDLNCGRAEREALLALFSGTLEFNNLFCSFKGEGTGAVRHMFSHHILKPERTPLEAHPWGTPASSGSFSTLFNRRLVKAHAYKENPVDLVLGNNRVDRVHSASQPLSRHIAESWRELLERPQAAYLKTVDSASTDLPDSSIDLIVTDPPYMDNVHYSELADFFHAWLRKLNPFPAYPSETDSTRRTQEVQNANSTDFGRAIGAVWKEGWRVLKEDGLLAFSFHQARLSGWTALVSSLVEAGFVITAIQPVKGEMSTSAAKHGREPSNLDAIVVCRKRGAEVVGFVGDSPSEAARAGEAKLEVLRQAGIAVGPGDVRSVLRGSVLSLHTQDPERFALSELAVMADALASAAVDDHLPAANAKAA